MNLDVKMKQLVRCFLACICIVISPLCFSQGFSQEISQEISQTGSQKNAQAHLQAHVQAHLQTSAENSTGLTQAIMQPRLVGELTQGGLIRGTTQVGTRVWLNGDELAVDDKGRFVFGFGRDAKLENILTWQAQGKLHAAEELNAAEEQNPTGLNTNTHSGKHSLVLNISKREYDIQRIEGVAKKYVSPPEEVLQRIRSDNRAIAQARATSSQLKDFLSDFIMPAKGRISGVYGSQRVFNGEPRRPHYGLDIANIVGTPVLAPAGGVISLAHEDMYYSGGTIIMDHGFGVSSTFIHLSKLLVNEGQRVEQGDIIGEIGATGRVTGPHLDWRINWFSERLDPALVLDPNPTKKNANE